MNCYVFHGVLLLTITATCFAIEYTPVVHTTNGLVRGEILHTVWNSVRYASFKGIPYARPPLGYLRFKPPIEADPWDGILDALTEGSPCTQIDFVYDHLSGSEDCLYLNVYTPHTDFYNKELQPKPVMVWIYGGSFSSGYSNSSLYGPDFFLEEDVILVTFNYRLGALGFLSLGHPNATGNAALKDQNLALKWVHENIANFGGDPWQVTLFGQSAGGVAVDLHVLSDKSAGLFQRSISMSASVFCPWAFHTPSTAIRRAFDLGTRLGYTTSSKEKLLEFLYTVPAGNLVTATEDLTILDLPFKPTLEDSSLAPEKDIFLSVCPWQKYKNGDYSRLPHIMGYTSEEAIRFSSPVLDLQTMINSLLSSNNDSIFSRLLTSRLQSSLPRNLSDAAVMEIVQIASDLLFVSGIDAKQRILNEHNVAPIYYYQLSYDSKYALHRTQYNISLDGVAHGDDIGYLFNSNLFDIPIDQNCFLSTFRKKIVRLWANFAKYANPTPFGTDDPLLDIFWPNSGKAGLQLDIDKELTVQHRQIRKRAELFEIGIKAKASLLTGCNEQSLRQNKQR